MDLKLFSLKDKLLLGIVGLVVLAFISYIIYNANKEITEPVEITPEQRAKVETEVADIKTKLKTCDEKSEDNKCSMLNLQLGIDYESLGLVTKAIKAYEQAGKESGSYVPYSNLGNIYRRLKDYSKAQEMYNKAMSIAPSVPSIYTRFFELYYYDLKKPPHEIDPFFQQAFKNTNYNPDVIRLYAFYGESINDPLIEINAWKALLQYDPNDEEAKKNLAEAEKKAREQGLLTE